MLESNKGLRPLKVIVNGIEITDSETWDRVIKSITEKDKEIAQLKFEQKKVAVEKLEELRARFDNSPIIFFHDTELNEKERAIVRDEYEDAKFIFRDNIDQLLAELKGESDE